MKDRKKTLKANAKALAKVAEKSATNAAVGAAKPLSGGKVSEFRDKIARDKALAKSWVNQHKNGSSFSAEGELHERNFRIREKNLSKAEIQQVLEEIFDFLEKNLDLNTYPVEKQGWVSEDYKIELDDNSITITYSSIWELCGYYYMDSSKAIKIRRS